MPKRFESGFDSTSAHVADMLGITSAIPQPTYTEKSFVLLAAVCKQSTDEKQDFTNKR